MRIRIQDLGSCQPWIRDLVGKNRAEIRDGIKRIRDKYLGSWIREKYLGSETMQNCGIGSTSTVHLQ